MGLTQTRWAGLGIDPARPGWVRSQKNIMVSNAEEASAAVICFDIIDSAVIDSDKILSETLTEEEKEEMYAIVSQLEGVNSRELIDFTSQENAPPATAAPPRHKVLTEKELDCLADNNSAQQTKYQTKWAIAVLKGMFPTVNSQKSTKHEKKNHLKMHCLPKSPKKSPMSVCSSLSFVDHQTKQTWYQIKDY